MRQPPDRREPGRRNRAAVFCPPVCWFACMILCASAFAQSPLYQEALEKYRNRDYLSALSAAERALQQESHNASYHHIYGLTLAALHRFPEAEENLRQAITLEPERAAFHYDLGYVLHQEKKYDQALPPLKRAVELDGDNLMARFLLGRVYVSAYPSLRIATFSRLALEQFAFIAKKKPSFPLVHYHMALIHINEGRPHKALEELDIELKDHPENVQARVERGEILLKMGQTQKALEQLLLAEKEAPGMSLVHCDLARGYRENSQRAQAIEAARNCVELDPQSADGHYLLGQLYREADQLELARQEMELFHRLKGKP